MVNKDFTDYVIVLFDAGDRVYHLTHLWNRKGLSIDHKPYPRNDHRYILELDRAYRVRWAPWSKVVRGPKGRISLWRTFHELVRSKKVGLLLYQEPCTHKCSSCGHKDDPEYCQSLPKNIYPMHISRIHQPSGELRG